MSMATITRVVVGGESLTDSLLHAIDYVYSFAIVRFVPYRSLGQFGYAADVMPMQVSEGESGGRSFTDHGN